MRRLCLTAECMNYLRVVHISGLHRNRCDPVTLSNAVTLCQVLDQLLAMVTMERMFTAIKLMVSRRGGMLLNYKMSFKPFQCINQGTSPNVGFHCLYLVFVSPFIVVFRDEYVFINCYI